MSGQSFTEEQKSEIKEIVHEALVEFFTDTGRIGKNVLIGIASVVGALIVIGGGAKILLAWFGFSQLK